MPTEAKSRATYMYVELAWKTNEIERVTGYKIEYSKDGSTWEEIAVVNKGENGLDGQYEYNYTDTKFNHSTNYCRIIKVNASGKKNISAIRMISTNEKNKVLL